MLSQMAGSPLLLRLNNIPLYVHTTFSYLFINLGTSELFSYLNYIMNNATMDMSICLFKIQISFPLDLYPVVKLLGHMVIVFNFTRNPHTVFHNAFTNLHFHQQCIKAPFSLRLLPLIFLMITILTDVNDVPLWF